MINEFQSTRELQNVLRGTWYPGRMSNLTMDWNRNHWKGVLFHEALFDHFAFRLVCHFWARQGRVGFDTAIR